MCMSCRIKGFQKKCDLVSYLVTDKQIHRGALLLTKTLNEKMLPLKIHILHKMPLGGRSVIILLQQGKPQKMAMPLRHYLPFLKFQNKYFFLNGRPLKNTFLRLPYCNVRL